MDRRGALRAQMNFADRRVRAALVAAGVLLMVWVRVAGLTRGAEGDDFYAFHPDEETLVHAALALDSPLDPPLTAYGLVPMYLARAALVGVDAEAKQRVYLRVRILAVVLSCALPPLVFWLGRRAMGVDPALWAAACVAFAPLAVQQAHFFTVDGVFVFFALLFFCALARALERPTYVRYALAGLAIGAAAATRLNGVALGLSLVAGHCAVGGWRDALARLRDARLWCAALAALAALLALQPYLLFDPGRLLQGATTDDFAYSVAVARGEVLRAWSLVDVHTVPYLHYWTDLWPLAAGWPLAVCGVCGLLAALWRRGRDDGPVFVWCLVCFALVGGLHTKHVRYLLPLLPFLALFAAQWVDRLRRRHWVGGTAVAVALVAVTVFYGLAFARIYRVEDSRIQAGRFLSANAPAGARVGLESGGFGMGQVVAGDRFTHAALGAGALFGARHYLSCAAAADYMRDRVESLDYIAAVDVNRYRQFTAVPELLPAAASFYRALWDGDLGFERVAHFKVYPQAFGLALADDGAEVSFLGYDHPAALVFRRRADAAEMDTLWGDWRRRLVRDGRCADGPLVRAADHYRASNWRAALAVLDEVAATHPAMRTTHFLRSAVYQQLGAADQERQATRAYMTGYLEESAYLVPWATAATALTLDLPDLMLAALRHGVQLAGRIGDAEHRRMAAAYVQVGHWARGRGHAAHAGAIYRLAGEMRPTSYVYMLQGMALFDQGAVEHASRAYERALELDPDNAIARINYGWNLYLAGRPIEAVDHFRRALQTGAHSAAAFNLGVALLAAGRVEEAAAAYARAVAEYGAAEGQRLGAVEDLRRQVELLGGVGGEILRRYWGAATGD